MSEAVQCCPECQRVLTNQPTEALRREAREVEDTCAGMVTCPVCGVSEHDGAYIVANGKCYSCKRAWQLRAETSCRECGVAVVVGPTAVEPSPGVAHHVDAWGAIDHATDADHVAIPEPECA